MQIYKTKDYDAASRKAAHIIAAQITLKPDCVLGLATGSTPIRTYEFLIDMCKNDDLDFSKVSSINLDEYKGLEASHNQSYRYFMDTHLFNHINIDKTRTFVPNGIEPDSKKACEDYDAIIQACDGIDLQLLGLGHNGHIAFNEPSTSYSFGTHCVDLTESTIEANKRFFASADEVPRQAYTMGIGSIMSAKKILLLVSGSAKAEILARVLNGTISPDVPASILRLHPDVIVVADEEALSKL